MSKGRILVVEDDFDISNMLRIYFGTDCVGFFPSTISFPGNKYHFNNVKSY